LVETRVTFIRPNGSVVIVAAFKTSHIFTVIHHTAVHPSFDWVAHGLLTHSDAGRLNVRISVRLGRV